MFIKRSAFERLISLLQGASWALVLVGAITFFKALYPFGIFIALIGSFLGSLVGLFFVIIFEIANIQIEKLNEMKKQTDLLEQLLKKKDDEILSYN